MCGFVGFSGGECPDRSVIRKMADTIAHRGPDSDGYFDDGRTALGFRRLSIIDLKGGDQPIYSFDRRYVIVFNGEIYNYRELRDRMKEEGKKFSTDSDTEVILRAYETYGKETPSMLRGMFAFVIWDRMDKVLFGARDPFGIKPFFYTGVNGTLVFGSEIKGILQYPGIRKEINPCALKTYLEFQYSPLEETMFSGIFRLPQGFYFTYSDGKLEKTQYFEPEFDEKSRSFDNAVSLIDETVCSSVDYHQIADVEVGSFLSGGVDSSYVASVVKPMKTYSVGFERTGFDETDLAAGLCRRLNMSNTKREITADEFFAALPDVQYHSDEPHANLSAVPLWYLAELASKDVKVVLSGEGADELFGGYDWYIESDHMRRYKKLPRFLRKGMAALLGHGKNHVARFFKNGAERVEDTYIGQAFIMNDGEADRLLAPEWRAEISYRDVTAPYYDKVKGQDDLTKKLYIDMKLWLPGDILLKADRMTMAHSLELRVPYLDRGVWEVARTLTIPQKTSGREAKTAFRAAAFRHIPQEWANRKKAGFLVPFREWIKEEKYAGWVENWLDRPYVATFFDVAALKKMLSEHREGKKNNARKIYTVLCFIIWYDRYFVNEESDN
jgi:asparagine synthase (glutamine-hydrolysing)